jgi:hypothetical protein
LLVKRGESVRDYVWSSVAKGYAALPRRRPVWLAAEAGLAMAQCADTAVGRRRFVEHLDSRAREDGVRAGVIEPGEDRRHSHLRHGWYWGSQAFAERMLQLARKGIATSKNRTYRSAPLFRAHDERQAQRLLNGGLAVAGLSTRELDSLPGSDVRKVALANLLLERTVARQSWIADKLAMRSAANVSQQVRRYRTQRPRLSAALKEYLESASLSRFVD